MKKIIFDLDDTLWNLNAKACALANVDLNKLVIFNIYKNKNLTKEDADRLCEIYCDPNLWKDIKYLCHLLIFKNSLNHLSFKSTNQNIEYKYRKIEDNICLQVISETKWIGYGKLSGQVALPIRWMS